LLEPQIDANCMRANDFAEALLCDQPELGKKIRRALMCTADDAKRALVEAIKFMCLASESDVGRLTPAHRVDLAWHELILFTRSYQEFCEKHFGKFVHHQPEGVNQDNQLQFAKTLQLYKQAFGPPPQDFWGSCDKTTSACGTCESDGE
jgi:hypothetical protein